MAWPWKGKRKPQTPFSNNKKEAYNWQQVRGETFTS